MLTMDVGRDTLLYAKFIVADARWLIKIYKIINLFFLINKNISWIKIRKRKGKIKDYVIK